MQDKSYLIPSVGPREDSVLTLLQPADERIVGGQKDHVCQAFLLGNGDKKAQKGCQLVWMRGAPACELVRLINDDGRSTAALLGCLLERLFENVEGAGNRRAAKPGNKAANQPTDRRELDLYSLVI